MPQLKQSFTWWSFFQNDATAQTLLSSAAAIGYEAVELIPQEYWSLAQDHGLRIASIMGHTSLTEGLNRREHHKLIEQELRTNLELAVRWKIPNLICFSGNRDGLDDTIGAEITAEGLARIAPEAEAASVNLILELLNSKIDHPDYQADHTSWGLQVCAMVNSPRVKLLYDIYHMQVMEGDIINTIRTHHTSFAHYHTAGVPGRHDLDDTQELNYPAIFRTILSTGYTGYIGHEFIPKGDCAPALQHAFDLCNITEKGQAL